jgi:hypothetical protein
MYSSDGGATFHDLTGNLPVADVHRIAYRAGRLYVATDVGIFTSVAGRTSWSRFGTGLPQVAYRSMKFDLTGRYLVAGAYGRGAWVYDFGSPARTSYADVPVAKLPGTGGGSSWRPQVPVTVPGAVLLLLVAGLVGRRTRIRRGVAAVAG